MSLILQSSGGGQITIQEPATASNFTQTLPAATGTVALLQTPSFATTIGVGGATPAASGAGITFPATASASSDANTLDDYEEGTWTPSLGGNTTYNTQVGVYTKVGRVVTCEFELHINSIGTGSISSISGLPFTANSQTNGKGGSVGYFETISASVFCLIMRLNASQTALDVGCTLAATTQVNTSSTIFQNNTRLRGSITYNAS
jgi:hypothetical protein